MKTTFKITIAISLLAIFTYSISCKRAKTGEELAKTNCSSCHLLPSPELLNKKSWKIGVLPQMSIFMGLTSITDSPKYGFDEMEKIMALDVLPEHPMVNQEDFDLISKYYIDNAPEKLALLPDNAHYHPLDSLFSIKQYPYSDNEISLLKFDKAHKQLYVGTQRGALQQLNAKDGKIIHALDLHSIPTDISFKNNGTFGITTTNQLAPNHDKGGFFTLATIKNKQVDIVNAVSKLPRPVNFVMADLNQDKQEDVVICSFGYYTGNLSWFELPPNAKPIEHKLKEIAGATCVIVQDMNKDGLPDIVALLGQGNEGVFIFYNKGHNEFEEEQVLKFPSVYGSLHIELQDFNKDGFMDILYANGDNGDETQILKPYHGIRIFLNDGKNNFKEKYFFPMHGVIKSLARDFDGDGDLDIISIAFFPDYSLSPQKSVVYLQNNGNLKFTPFISAKTDSGRWMVMDTFDYDNDGDEDVIMGACYDNVRMGKAKIKAPKTTLLVLQNRQK